MRDIATLRRQSKQGRAPGLNRSSYANLFGGLLVGVPAALLGAAIWTLFSLITEMRLGLVALAVGALVGLGVRSGGKGTTADFGVLGALLTVAACALGQTMCQIALNANLHRVSYLHELQAASLSDAFTQALHNSTLLTAIIYAGGVCVAFRLSMK
jgi:phosphate/sulfate permease